MTRRRNIVIVGAGGFGREVAWLIREVNRVRLTWNLLGFLDVSPQLIGKECGSEKIIGTDEFLFKYPQDLWVVIGIGNPIIIERMRSLIEGIPNLHFPNVIHPSIIWDRERLTLGQGNIICAGNVLTTDIKIGSFNILNLSSTYGHDVVIGDHCVINPGVNLSGGVTVGNTCMLGAGCVVLEKRTIGNKVVVGSGAVVTKDVADGTTVIGIPARPTMTEGFPIVEDKRGGPWPLYYFSK